MTEAKRKLQLVALNLGAITNALDLQLARVPVIDAGDDIRDQRPRQTPCLLYTLTLPTIYSV